MSYLTSENGTMVNMIKQKFEQNLSTKNSIENNDDNGDNDQKEQLRRSLSASPVKIKKNLKLNVTRQLSNPGKNIKRTPAFRGDKLTKIRNLNSPSKEKVFSIVNQNVKIFEEKPEYGKLGKVKKKSTEGDFDAEDKDFDVVDYGDRNKYEYRSIKSNNRPPLTKEKKITCENSVKTTVISRQKNISPIYNIDYDFGQTSKRLNTNDDFVLVNDLQKDNPTQLDKFIMNGAEYTKITKSKTVNDKTIKSNEFTQDNDRDNTMIDIREELSRRKSTKFEKDQYNNNSCEATVSASSSSSKFEDDSTDELTERLKAALNAPLPPGPPPKKPPRTFAHCPINRKYDFEAEENAKSMWTRDRLDSCGKNIGVDVTGSSKSVRNYEVIIDDEDNGEADNGNDDDDVVSGSSKERTRIAEKEIGLSLVHNVQNVNSTLPGKNSSALDDIKEHSPTASTSSVKCRTVRDSKKMLEKLETVLIQHQKALGPKVIVPRKDKFDLDMHFNNNINLNNKKNQNDLDNIENTDKNKFFNRLSRTLDDPKKANNEKKSSESKTRKHSTFDCLPYLNCASPIMYEQPNFTTYFTESSSSSLNGLKSKSDDVLNNSISTILSSNNDFYDQQLSPAAKRLSTELTTFLDGKRRLSNSAKNEERIYAEPFSFDQKSGTDIMELSKLSPEEHNYLSHNWHQCDNGFISNQKRLNNSDESLSFTRREKKREPELHYMCTPIEPLLLENNNNTSKIKELEKLSRDINFHTFLNKSNSLSRSFLDGPSQTKVKQLLNQAFGQSVMAGVEISTDSNTSSDTDSIASTPSSVNDELSSFNEKLRLFKNRESSTGKTNKEELHRNLTEKRKHYVRRISVKYSEKHETSLRDRRDKLFDVCLLVELNLCTREPYIKDNYPIHAKAPAWIENFCFPDAQDWPSSDSNQNQFYSLFLMDDKGDCRYGYCCRVKPEGGPILPLAYCMITKFRASGFYHKVLLELESRHGLPDKRRRKFIEDLYNSPMPKPGNCIKLTTDKIEILTVSSHNNNFMSNDNDICSTTSETNGTNDVILNNEHRSVKVELGSPEKIIVRSGDPRLEEKDMSQLFDAVSNKVLIFLFGTLLLERRVVLVCEKLSKLSSCVEALQSLLYPFNWPHTFIPVLPDIPELSEILQAPLPFVIGILKSKNSANSQIDSVQDGIVIDLDTSKVLCAVGDESTILPSRLQKGIRCALQLVSSNVRPADGIRNFLVSEAFLRVFVETCVHFEKHLGTQQDNKIIFQKESFVKASPSKTYRYFLEWFVETTMFNAFVTDYIAHIEGTTVHDYYNIKLFIQRVAEYQKSIETNSQSKKFLSKKKTFGDRLKDLTNFYT